VFAASDTPKTNVTAGQAVELLKEGNAAFINGSCTVTGAPGRIHELAGGQAPFAVIVGCSDSRSPPGELFNRGLGDLFIVRVAGNTVDSVALGTIEYGTAVLGAPLVLILGHTQCGAVEAAVKVVKDKARFPGSIGTMVAPIVPAVKSLSGNDDLVNRAVRANVQRVVARLKGAKPIIAKAVADGKVKVVGAVYDLSSGKVDFDIAIS
jgi:carbonic anhydrase